MLMCNELLTLVRHIREDDGDRYDCIPVIGSWYRKISIAITEDGAKPVNTCRCRIPEKSLPKNIVPRNGDFVVRGLVKSASRVPAGLDGLDYMQITSVGDNRRGARGIRHWAVSGA